MTDLLQWMQPLFAQAFVLWGAPVSWVEVVAFVLAIAMVVCNIRVNPIGWPLAIVSSLLYVALFWDNKLYGDASLQVFFALVAGWGWWQWLRGTQEGGHALRVRSMGGRGRLAVVAATLALWPVLGWFLKHYTDTDVPWWDAFPTAASVVGQWLLGRKYVENWPMWVVVNTVSIALFAYKGLWLTAVLYAIFLGMSFAGWRAWQRVERAA
ncbi:nicotinamide riboside transporter PnuC [Rhizobacter sp. P5_C2]